MASSLGAIVHRVEGFVNNGNDIVLPIPYIRMYTFVSACQPNKTLAVYTSLVIRFSISLYL